MTSDLRLYELTDAISAAIDGGYYVDEETGEVIFDSSDVDALAVRIEDKLNGCANVVESLEGYVDSIDAEIKRLQELKRHYNSRIESLKGYMLRNVRKLNGKVELPTHRLSTRKSRAVEIIDLDAIPEGYKRIKVEPDKRAIAAAISAGVDVPGATLVQNERLVLK